VDHVEVFFPVDAGGGGVDVRHVTFQVQGGDLVKL